MQNPPSSPTIIQSLSSTPTCNNMPSIKERFLYAIVTAMLPELRLGALCQIPLSSQDKSRLLCSLLFCPQSLNWLLNWLLIWSIPLYFTNEQRSMPASWWSICSSDHSAKKLESDGPKTGAHGKTSLTIEPKGLWKIQERHAAVLYLRDINQ